MADDKDLRPFKGPPVRELRPDEKRYADFMTHVRGRVDKLTDLQVRNIVKEVTETRKDVLSRLAAVTPDEAGTWGARHLQTVKAQIDDALGQFAERYGAHLVEGIEGAVDAGAGMASGAFLAGLGEGTGLDLALPKAFRNQLELVHTMSAATLIKGVGADVANKANRIVRQGILGAKFPHEIIKDLKPLLDTPSRPTERFGGLAYQAQRVMRTEMVRSFNEANRAGEAHVVNKLGHGGAHRIWLHSGQGPGARPSHIGLDGEMKPIGEPFDVGGYLVEGPHAPELPAEHVIMCKCSTMLWYPDRWGDPPPRPQPGSDAARGDSPLHALNAQNRAGEPGFKGEGERDPGQLVKDYRARGTGSSTPGPPAPPSGPRGGAGGPGPTGGVNPPDAPAQGPPNAGSRRPPPEVARQGLGDQLMGKLPTKEELRARLAQAEQAKEALTAGALRGDIDAASLHAAMDDLRPSLGEMGEAFGAKLREAEKAYERALDARDEMIRASRLLEGGADDAVEALADDLRMAALTREHAWDAARLKMDQMVPDAEAAFRAARVAAGSTGELLEAEVDALITEFAGRLDRVERDDILPIVELIQGQTRGGKSFASSVSRFVELTNELDAGRKELAESVDELVALAKAAAGGGAASAQAAADFERERARTIKAMEVLDGDHDERLKAVRKEIDELKGIVANGEGAGRLDELPDNLRSDLTLRYRQKRKAELAMRVDGNIAGNEAGILIEKLSGYADDATLEQYRDTIQTLGQLNRDALDRADKLIQEAMESFRVQGYGEAALAKAEAEAAANSINAMTMETRRAINEVREGALFKELRQGYLSGEITDPRVKAYLDRYDVEAIFNELEDQKTAARQAWYKARDELEAAKEAALKSGALPYQTANARLGLLEEEVTTLLQDRANLYARQTALEAGEEWALDPRLADAIEAGLKRPHEWRSRKDAVAWWDAIEPDKVMEWDRMDFNAIRWHSEELMSIRMDPQIVMRQAWADYAGLFRAGKGPNNAVAWAWSAIDPERDLAARRAVLRGEGYIVKDSYKDGAGFMSAWRAPIHGTKGAYTDLAGRNLKRYAEAFDEETALRIMREATRNTMRHEYGHIVDYSITRWAAKNPYITEAALMAREVTTGELWTAIKAGMHKVGHHVSDYGASLQAEAWAEGFASWYRPTRYARDVNTGSQGTLRHGFPLDQLKASYAHRGAGHGLGLMGKLMEGRWKTARRLEDIIRPVAGPDGADAREAARQLIERLYREAGLPVPTWVRP